MTPTVASLPDLPHVLCVPLERLTKACGCALRFTIVFQTDAGGQEKVGKVDLASPEKTGALSWPDVMAAWFDAEAMPEPGAIVVRHEPRLVAVLTFRTADEAMAFKMRWL